MLRTLALEANITSRLALSGDSLHVIDCAGAVHVRVMLREETRETEMLAGLGTNYLESYSVIEITSTLTQKIVIWAGYGDLVDRRNRAFISGSSELISTGKALKKKYERVLLLDKRLNRSSVLITTNRRIGVGGPQITRDNAIQIESGQSLELKTQAAIYVMALDVNGFYPNVRALEEVN